MRKNAVLIVLTLLPLAGCLKADMWAECDDRASDVTGTDGSYALVCRDGSWQPVMTVREYVQFVEGGRPVIGPLPTQPVPSTTSTVPSTTSTTSTSSTTSTTTTTTAVPADPPILTGVSPDSGPETGGQTVQLYGSRLAGTTEVLFGTIPVTFTVISDTLIHAVTPVMDPGTYPVSVTTPDGTVTRVDGWGAGGGA